MTHKIAILVYGQPRMIAETFKWRAEFWHDVIRMSTVDVDIEWYYHLWDGVNGNQLFLDDTDISDYHVAKNKSSAPHWLNSMHRVHPKKTRAVIDDLHTQYGFVQAFYPENDIDVNYEKLEQIYTKYVVPPLATFSAEVAKDTEEAYWIFKFLKFHSRNRTPIDIASMVSAASVVDLMKVIAAGERYDTVVLCRSDSIIQPSSAKEFAKIISNNTNPWFNQFNNIDIVQTGKVSGRNDLILHYPDFYFVSKQSTIEFMFENWQHKISSMIVKNSINKLLEEKYKLFDMPYYNIHAIPSLLSLKPDAGGKTVGFSNWYSFLDEQTVLRNGLDYDTMEVNDDNFKNIAAWFAYTQGEIRPYV